MALLLSPPADPALGNLEGAAEGPEGQPAGTPPGHAPPVPPRPGRGTHSGFAGLPTPPWHRSGPQLPACELPGFPVRSPWKQQCADERARPPGCEGQGVRAMGQKPSPGDWRPAPHGGGRARGGLGGSEFSRENRQPHQSTKDSGPIFILPTPVKACRK